MRTLAALLCITIVVAGLAPLPLTGAEAAKPPDRLVVPLTGTVDDGGTFVGSFSGSFSITSFEARGNAIFAVGMVSGVVTVPPGGTPGIARSGISGPLALPVTATSGAPLATRSAVLAQATCDVLHLQFGGLSLDLLGLQVALSPVTIDLTGGEGALGNLVCQIVALLNTAGDVVGLVVNLLNTLLGLLGGLVGGVA